MMPDAGPSKKPERLVLTTGAAIGLSILGDSFLYANLPIEAKNLGIALPLVGVLLSANRLVRLGSNTWASAIFERLGPRRPFIGATIIALMTTAIYGARSGFFVFLLARIGWGIAWSALRQGGYQAVWAGGEGAKGRLMGLLWGMIRLGSAFSVVMGGYLRDRFGYQVGVFAVMGVSALAIPVAFSIRWPEMLTRKTTSSQSPLQGWRQAFETRHGRRLLAVGFIHASFEGILISTTSLYLAGNLGSSDLLMHLGIRVGTVAGFLLAVRWTSDMIFGPSVGALSDRLGQPRTLVLLACVLLAAITGVANFVATRLVLCIILVFISGAGLNITLSAVANGVALHSKRPHLFVGVYSTAIDAGAAAGPLIAYSVGGLVGMNNLYVLSAIVLTSAVLLYWRSADVSM
jgi:MFS family permease